MPKFTVIDKLGMSYLIEADYVITTTEDCGTVSFVNKSDNYFGNTVVAQFQLSNITGFFNNNSGSTELITDDSWNRYNKNMVSEGIKENTDED